MALCEKSEWTEIKGMLLKDVMTNVATDSYQVP